MTKKNNIFLKSILILASGSIIAQMINIFSSPIITRIFSPENIGIYTYILTIAQLFGSVINGRYNLSIVSEKSDKNIIPLIQLSGIIGIFMTIIVSIGMSFYFYYNELDNNIIFMFLNMILLLTSFSLINILSSYNNRLKQYRILAKVSIIRATIQNLGAILFSFYYTGMLALLIPYIIGQYFGIRQQSKPLMKQRREIFKFDIRRIKFVARKHINQPKYSMPAIFINNFSYVSITIFIEILYSFSVVGFYALTVRMLGLPINMISGNISKVFLENASKEYNETGQFFSTYKKAVSLLVIIALPVMIVLLLFSPSLFSMFLGEEWYRAGEYARYLAPMFAIRFIVSAITPSMLIASKQVYDLIFQSMFIVFSVLCFLSASILNLDVDIFLICISITYTIVYFFFMKICWKAAKGK